MLTDVTKGVYFTDMNTTARNFALQLGALISLYLSLSFLLVLLFGVINLSFPDATDYYWDIESAASNVRLGFAMVIVFFPTYLILTRIVNKIRRSEAEGAYLGLTRWLIYLSLLVGGAVLLGDLVAVIMAFLEGEITQRFIFKAAAVSVVTGAAFHYYLLDARGYWIAHEQKSIMFAIGAIVFVLAALGYGITNIDTPGEVRERKLDEQQTQDLQQIQYSIESYYQFNQVLPNDLTALAEYEPLPSAPEGREAYTYELTEEGFRLCATFGLASQTDSDAVLRPYAPFEKDALIVGGNNWSHDAGRHCFARKVNADTLPSEVNTVE